MIIGNFHVVCVPILPDEAHAELIIDPDSMLASPFPLQGMQPVSGWNFQIIELSSCVQHLQLSPSHGTKIRGRDFSALSCLPEFPSLCVCKRLDQKAASS